jgi:hypothetical protein
VNTPNIFGSEDNNWYTDVYGNGFYKRRYQDLDFRTGNEKYQTILTKLGFIASYSGTTSATIGPAPITPLSSIIQGDPSTSPSEAVIVGAPYHFYFGLNNGKTAVDRFYKLYVATEE